MQSQQKGPNSKYTGAGKSTLAKTIIRKLPSFTRLSGDKIIYESQGLYAIDYPAEEYAQHQESALAQIQKELSRLLAQRDQDIVLDLSFWNKEYRDEYKALVESGDGRWVLVFLDTDKDVLWTRVQRRKAKWDALPVNDIGRDGDSAFNVSEEVFDMYCNGFERPEGEGEVVVKIQ